jgi:hypothetical protein
LYSVEKSLEVSKEKVASNFRVEEYDKESIPHKLYNKTTVTIDILEIRKKINSCSGNSQHKRI